MTDPLLASNQLRTVRKLETNLSKILLLSSKSDAGDKLKLSMVSGGFDVKQLGTIEELDLELIDSSVGGFVISQTFSDDILPIIKKIKSMIQDGMKPILAVLKNDPEDDYEKYYFAGASDTIREPHLPQILACRLKSLLRNQETFELAMKSEQQAKFLIRTLTHDLANPLSIIEMSLMKAKKVSESEAAKSSIGKANSYLGRIKDVLAAARDAATTDEFSVKKSKVRIDFVLDQVIDDFRHTLTKKDIDVQVQWDIPMTKAEVFTDVRILRDHVLSNLLSNAIKFSHTGSQIIFRVDAIKQGIMVSVEDRGVGIPDSIKGKLFDFATKTSRKGTENEPGTGHGLPLMKSYVEKIGGSLTFSSKVASESSKDSGTIFNIYIPYGKNKVQSEKLDKAS